MLGLWSICGVGCASCLIDRRRVERAEGALLVVDDLLGVPGGAGAVQ